MVAPKEEAMEYLRGADARITAWDVHGNEQTQLFRVRQSVGSQAAERMLTEGGVGAAGTVSGFTHGVAELPDLVLMIERQPGELAEGLEELSTDYVDAEICDRQVPPSVLLDEEADDLAGPCERTDEDSPESRGEFWVELGKGAAVATHQQQDRDNPYELEADVDGPREQFEHCLVEGRFDDEFDSRVGIETGGYCDFAEGWYRGYALWILVETVVGSKGTMKGASSVDDVADAARVAGQQADDLGSVAARQPQGPASRVNQHLIADGGRHLDDVDVQFASSGRAQWAKHRYDRVDTDVLQRLDTAQRTELLRHLADSPDGHRLVNDLGPEDADALFSLHYAEADATTLRANLFERYSVNGLDATERATFARLTADPDVRRSWVRAAGDPEVKSSNVGTTIRRVQDMEGDGHGVLEFHRSNELNEIHEQNNRLAPHEQNEIVADFELAGEKKLYRLRGEAADVEGEWMIERYILEDATTRSELYDRMALLPDEWGVDYRKLSELDTSRVEHTTEMRVSTTGGLNDRPGGIRQYRIQEYEDIQRGWEDHGELAEYVDIEGS